MNLAEQWCIVIAYYCDKPKKKPKGFTHLIIPPLVTPRNRRWFTFQMKAEHGRLTAIVDGRKIAAANIPSGTAGMPGFLIHHYKRQTGCIVRLRNINIKFLKPTQKQLQEFKLDAMTNWRNRLLGGRFLRPRDLASRGAEICGSCRTSLPAMLRIALQAGRQEAPPNG